MELKDIRHIAVIGPGMMGHCVAQEFAFAGYRVSLCGRSQERLDDALVKIRRNLTELAGWGIISQDKVDPALDRVSVFTDLEKGIKDADFVVESVLEDVELKQALFAELEVLCSEKAILTSNTSGLMPSMISKKMKHPERFVIAHFWNPPYLMPLVEVVKGDRSSEEATRLTYDLMKEIGKSPILIKKEALGFIGNRLQFALIREAAYLVEQGIASAEDVDIACKDGFGRRLPVAGPFEYLEHNDGWDLVVQVEKYLRQDLDSRSTPSPVLEDKVGTGQLGAKTGDGFYNWTPEYTESYRKRMVKNLVRLQRPLE